MADNASPNFQYATYISDAVKNYTSESFSQTDKEAAEVIDTELEKLIAQMRLFSNVPFVEFEDEMGGDVISETISMFNEVSNFIDMTYDYGFDLQGYYRDHSEGVYRREVTLNDPRVPPTHFERGLTVGRFSEEVFSHTNEWLVLIGEILQIEGEINASKVDVERHYHKYFNEDSMGDVQALPLVALPTVSIENKYRPMLIIPNFNSQLISAVELEPKLRAFDLTSAYSNRDMFVFSLVYRILLTYRPITIFSGANFILSQKSPSALYAMFNRKGLSGISFKDITDASVLASSIHKRSLIITDVFQCLVKQIPMTLSMTSSDVFSMGLLDKSVMEDYTYYASAFQTVTALKEKLKTFRPYITTLLTDRSITQYIINGVFTTVSTSYVKVGSKLESLRCSSSTSVTRTESLVKRMPLLRRKISFYPKAGISTITVTVDEQTGKVNRTPSINYKDTIRDQVKKVFLPTANWEQAIQIGGVLSTLYGKFYYMEEGYLCVNSVGENVALILSSDCDVRIEFNGDTRQQNVSIKAFATG